MSGFVANIKQKQLTWIPQSLLCMGLGAFISLCLVSYGSILFIWQTTDPGCVCYSQRVYMSRGRFENMREMFDTTFYILAPALSFAFFKLMRIAPKNLHKPFLISSIISILVFLVCRAIWSENIPAHYYQFISVGKIMAYHFGEFARIFVQPMFTWSFLGSIGVFLSLFVFTYFAFRKQAT
ncbi:hypothetical protein KA183_08005 [bacterium]|nr:hypothetical protein [bacterium]QQR58407.1 MAG: hypothetical protein IPG59_02615 [Candidatus Melainabacteria bacterium]